MLTYRARCHCGQVRFTFRSEAITSGCRCNCSLCVRRGAVMSPAYLPPEGFDDVQGWDALTLYQFGEKSLRHYFCASCGISPFSVVASIPDDYVGTAKPGYYRVNLGCVDDLDVGALALTLIDGRSY